MLDGRVKIDRVFGLQHELFAADPDGKRSLQQEKEFNSGMLMWLDLLRGHLLKFRQKGAQLAFRRTIVKAFEKVWDVLRSRSLRKPHAFLPPHDSDDAPLSLVRKEIIQPHTEHHGNPEQGRQSREQFPPLQLRQQCRRKPGVLAQLHESHVLAQAQGPQFLADGIPAKTFNNRVRSGSHFMKIKQKFLPVNRAKKRTRHLCRVNAIRNPRALPPASLRLLRRFLLKQSHHAVDRILLLLLLILIAGRATGECTEQSGGDALYVRRELRVGRGSSYSERNAHSPHVGPHFKSELIAGANRTRTSEHSDCWYVEIQIVRLGPGGRILHIGTEILDRRVISGILPRECCDRSQFLPQVEIRQPRILDLHIPSSN